MYKTCIVPSALRLHETDRTGQIFEQLSVQVQNLKNEGPKPAHLVVQKFVPQFYWSCVSAQWNHVSLSRPMLTGPQFSNFPENVVINRKVKKGSLFLFKKQNIVRKRLWNSLIKLDLETFVWPTCQYMNRTCKFLLVFSNSCYKVKWGKSTDLLVKAYSLIMNIESRVHQLKKSITLQIVTTKNSFQLMQGQQLQW